MNGGKTADVLEQECGAILDLIDLSNRTVLDIGTWNGYYAFAAKRAGARHVMATDSYVWRSPLFRGRETFELARECLAIDVDAEEIDPTDFPGNLEPADVVLFLGVFYHLIDPIMVLQKVAALTRDLLIVETHQDLHDLPRPAMVFYPGAELNGDDSNWWGPNPQCLLDLLEHVGFRQVFYQRHPHAPGRGIYHAFRTADVAAGYLKKTADNITFFDLHTQAGRQAVFGRQPPNDEHTTATAPPAPGTDSELATLQAAHAALHRECAELAAHRDALLASTSWRLTAPMRMAVSWLRHKA